LINFPSKKGIGLKEQYASQKKKNFLSWQPYNKCAQILQQTFP